MSKSKYVTDEMITQWEKSLNELKDLERESLLARDGKLIDDSFLVTVKDKIKELENLIRLYK